MKLRLLTTLFTLVGLFSLSVAVHASFAAQPKNFEAIYKAKYHGISVTATRKLETLEDGSQLFTFVADSWLADLKETSLFRWTEGEQIVPLRYEYERNVLGRNREAVLDFDWEENRVLNNVQRKPWKMEVPDLALDKLSYQLQIRADLINGRHILRYKVADGGRMKEYNFRILGHEEVDTDAGRFDAIKLERLRDDDRQTLFWMAKDWDYMVVRLKQTEDDGASYEIDLHEATLDGKRVRGL